MTKATDTPQEVAAPRKMIAVEVWSDVVIAETKDGKCKGKVSVILCPLGISHGDEITISIRRVRHRKTAKGWVRVKKRAR